MLKENANKATASDTMLNHFEKEMTKREEKKKLIKQMNDNRVTLNVGGEQFHTSRPILTSAGGIFAAILNENQDSLFLDRDGSVYPFILNYLRQEATRARFSSTLLPNDQILLRKLMMMADFLELTNLQKLCKEKRDKILDWGQPI